MTGKSTGSGLPAETSFVLCDRHNQSWIVSLLLRNCAVRVTPARGHSRPAAVKTSVAALPLRKRRRQEELCRTIVEVGLEDSACPAGYSGSSRHRSSLR